MPLIKCHECEAQVSTEAKSCPSCGAKVRLPKKKVGIVGIFLASVMGISIVGSVLNQQEQDRQEEKKSPEQKAAEEKAKLRIGQRDALTVAALKSIHDHLRNPESVQWGDVLVNDDGSVICIDYRAQNGFGGMNHESIAFLGGKAKTDAQSWNKNCAGKTLNDVKDFALRRL